MKHMQIIKTVKFLTLIILCSHCSFATEINKLALKQFNQFYGILENQKKDTEITFEKYHNFVVLQNLKWQYSIDIAGNQTFKTKTGQLYIKDLFDRVHNNEHPSPNVRSIPEIPDQDFEKKTKQIASKIIERNLDLPQVLFKNEFVVFRICNDKEKKLTIRGRNLIRLSDKDNNKYFQIIFSPKGHPIRVDTNVVSEKAIKVSEEIGNNHATVIKPIPNAPPLNFGTFFDPNEHRFEINAYSYEGEPFLNTQIKENHFGWDKFDVSQTHFIDIPSYKASKDYKSWCWHWWNIYGRVNGARGNFLEVNRRWEGNISVIHHRNLKDYGIQGEDPKIIKEFKLSDGKVHKFPHDVSRELELSFYKDLEQCHVAAIFTHMGSIQNTLQMRRGLDVWCKLGNDKSKFGNGNLRHLILQGCSAMSCFKQDDARLVFSEWLPANYIDGLRTASGIDGEGVGLDRDGWRFFGRYNKGDSISDSWAFGVIDECPGNDPVTLAYGATFKETIETLIDGRFSLTKAEPIWCIASIWSSKNNK